METHQSLTDERQSHVGEGRKVAAGAERTLGRDDRQDVPVEQGEH